MVYERGCPTYHVEFPFLVKRHGEEEGAHDAARHGEIGVDDGSDLGVARGQTTIKAGPEQPQEQSAWKGGKGVGDGEGGKWLIYGTSP